MLSDSIVHLADTGVVAETVRIASDTVRIAGRVHADASGWVPALSALGGAAAGAVLGAFWNFLFNRRLENQRNVNAKRLFTWQKKFERDERTRDAWFSVRGDATRLALVLTRLRSDLEGAAADRSAAVKAWTVAKPAVERHSKAIVQGELRKTLHLSARAEMAIQVLEYEVNSVLVAGQDYALAIGTAEPTALRRSVAKCLEAWVQFADTLSLPENDLA